MSEASRAKLWMVRYRLIPHSGSKPGLASTIYLFNIHPVEWAAQEGGLDYLYVELEAFQLAATGFEAHRLRDLIVSGGSLEVQSA